MKLHALRVNEVGCFTRPVALEGFSGGLDVLAGPNELGKSTLFGALRAVLYEKFDSQNKEVRALRSERNGVAIGSPLVEAEFEVDGRKWRVRKRFLSGKVATNAELTDLASGDVLVRGGEVDEHLRRLLAMDEKGQDRLGLLWVGQTEALQDLALAAPQTGQIESLIADEIEQVADGGNARAVLTMAKAQLDAMVTTRGAKKNSEYANALALQSETANDLEITRQRLNQAGERLERLAELRLELDRLANPVEREKLRTRILQAEEKYNRASEIAEGFKAASERLAHAQLAYRQAGGERREFERVQSEIASIEQQTQLAATTIERLQAEAGALAQRRQQVRDEAEQLRARRSMLETAAGAALARVRLADQAARLKAASAARAALGKLEAQLAAEKELPERAAKAEAALREIELLRARLSAAAPRLRVQYVPGAQGRIRLGDAPVADGSEVLVSAPTILTIEGIGQIEIAPAFDEGREDMTAQLALTEGRLAQLLGAMDCRDVGQAQSRAEKYRSVEAEARSLRDELRYLTPGGEAEVEAEIARCQMVVSQASELPAELAAELAELGQDDIKAAIAEIDGKRAAQEAAREAADRAYAGATSELARLEAVGQAAAARLPALRQIIAQIDDLPRQAQELAAREAETRENLHIAQHDLDARQRLRPSDQDLQQLASALAEVRQLRDGASQRIIELEKQIERLDGELQRDREEGLGEKVLELEGILAQAGRKVTRFEREIAGLRRLQEALLQARQQTSNRFLKPVEQRMLPYLHILFPDARLRLDAAFGVDDLVRGDQHDALQRLSIGTREQLAVLVRLGFARLLADKGRPAPVVLDDALVYSDDERIARMFAALEAASAYHQVIVLTCRTSTFQRLGGHRLELRPSHFV